MVLGKKYRGQAGQVLLIVILAVIVASTVGLSLASRSIISLRTSTEEAESQKALAAAEAGIERSMQRNVSIANTTLPNNSNYSAVVTSIIGNTFLINGGNSIPKDEGADLWLADYDPDLNYNSPYNGNLTIYWGDSAKTACDNPALEIIIISGSKNNPVSSRYAYDPCPTRQVNNHFSTPSGGATVSTKTFPYGLIINAISSGLIARIIPIYGDVSVGVIGSSDLPLQGYQHEATGTSGQANREIKGFAGWPQTYLPYLSYGLFVAN